MNLKLVSILFGCATVLLLSSRVEAAIARIKSYNVVRVVSGYSVSDQHIYSYTATYSSTQVGAYRSIKNISNTGTVVDIAFWQTTGSGDFSNPTPPISCNPHNPYYELHVYISEYLAAPGEPNVAEDWRDASAQ